MHRPVNAFFMFWKKNERKIERRKKHIWLKHLDVHVNTCILLDTTQVSKVSISLPHSKPHSKVLGASHVQYDM